MVTTRFIVDESGNKTSVILPLEDYEELLEDIHDLTIIAERKDEPSISLEELKKRLKADGLLLRLSRGVR
ncbi:MAG: hypothetical protein NUV76_12465 [Candidatus Kuenenia sp.]|nr:hypothetical protein [Candidatus Kuenenia sp.]